MRVVADISSYSNTSASIYLNGKKVADTIQTDATLYPSGMLVAKLGNNGSEEEQTLAYTKHYYAGTQRVSSKIGTTENLGDFLQDWITQGLGGPVDAIGSSMDVLENAEEGVVQVYTELGIDPPSYESSPTFIPVQSFVHGDNEDEIYWFHPDHLGSTSYITNVLGEVSQHMEYFAFGETFVEEHRSSNNSPYKFNGKELDEETGWYYYGARYYDPRISVFLSYDPMGEITMTPYQYTYQNPVNLTDPSGMAAEDPPSWFERNISRPIGNFFKGLFGGKKFNTNFQMEVMPVATIDDEGNITGYENPEGFNSEIALEIMGTTAAMLNEGMSEVDPIGITNISRLLAVSTTGMSYEDLNNANNQILGINTNYNVTEDGIMAALFVVPEGSAFLKYGLKVGKPVQLMGSFLDGPLQKEASKLFKDRNFVKQIDGLLGQVQNGNMNPGIGTRWNSFNSVNEFRHKDGARIYFTLKDNVINILGYSNKSNQTKVINAIKKSL